MRELLKSADVVEPPGEEIAIVKEAVQASIGVLRYKRAHSADIVVAYRARSVVVKMAMK